MSLPNGPSMGSDIGKRASILPQPDRPALCCTYRTPPAAARTAGWAGS